MNRLERILKKLEDLEKEVEAMIEEEKAKQFFAKLREENISKN